MIYILEILPGVLPENSKGLLPCDYKLLWLDLNLNSIISLSGANLDYLVLFGRNVNPQKQLQNVQLNKFFQSLNLLFPINLLSLLQSLNKVLFLTLVEKPTLEKNPGNLLNCP